MNYNKKLFFISLILLIILITFDTIAKVSSFYYFYPNADVLMHFVGGLSITALAISMLQYMKMNTKLNIFIVIFFISIFWEFVEFSVGKNVFINANFWIDTGVDLLMNALGGIMAYICFYKMPQNRARKENLQK